MLGAVYYFQIYRKDQNNAPFYFAASGFIIAIIHLVTRKPLFKKPKLIINNHIIKTTNDDVIKLINTENAEIVDKTTRISDKVVLRIYLKESPIYNDSAVHKLDKSPNEILQTLLSKINKEDI